MVHIELDRLFSYQIINIISKSVNFKNFIPIQFNHQLSQIKLYWIKYIDRLFYSFEHYYQM